jgi:talin
MLSAIKYLGTCLISFAKSIDADQLHHKSESLSDLQGNYSLISKHIATVSKTLQDDTNPDLLVIMDASEKIQEAFITIQDKISYSKSDYSAISKVDKDGKRLITNFMNILSQDPNITPGEIATDFANIYESLVLNASAAANIFTEEELVKQLVEQVRELGGTTLKAVNILKKTNKGESKKFANEYLKEVTFKIVDLNKFLTANSVTIKTAEMVYNEIEEIGAELDTNLIFAEAGQLDDIGDTTTFGDQHAVILSAACILLDDGKKLVSERIRPQKETASIYENSLASLKTITTATVKATLCLTSSKNETQVKILTLVKNVSDATNALIQECQNCHGDKTQLRGPNGPLEKHFASVDALLKAFSDYNSSSEGDDTALKFILKDIDHSAELLQNSDAALGSALPAEVIAIARLLAGSAVSLISASSNKGSLQPILAKVASQIQDIARAGKAVLAGAPEAQRIETTDVLITLISSCRQLAVSSMDGESTADKKKIMNAAVKSVSKSVTEVVKVSSLLVPSGYVDPNDPNVIAERELLSAANAIEAAAKKLALLRPAERPREANEELDFGEQILEGFGQY